MHSTHVCVVLLLTINQWTNYKWPSHGKAAAKIQTPNLRAEKQTWSPIKHQKWTERDIFPPIHSRRDAAPRRTADSVFVLASWHKARKRDRKASERRSASGKHATQTKTTIVWNSGIVRRRLHVLIRGGGGRRAAGFALQGPGSGGELYLNPWPT